MKTRFYILSILLILTWQIIFAQKNKNRDSLFYKNYFNINVFQLSFRDIRVSYEFLIYKNYFIKATCGYKYCNDDSVMQEWTMMVVPGIVDAQEWYYAKLGVGHAYKFEYSSILYSSYLLLDFLYRYNTMEPKYRIHEVMKEEASFGSFRSSEMYVYGCNIIFGTKLIIFKNTSRLNSYLDIYIGLGLRYFDRTTITYAYKDGYVDVEDLIPTGSPDINQETRLMPTIHLGLRFGFAWK